jgi:AcrR family transcriptional regulator
VLAAPSDSCCRLSSADNSVNASKTLFSEESAIELVRNGGTLTLDSVANAVSVTKPGLMYHFPSKEALTLAVVDFVLDRYELELGSRLGSDPSAADPHSRLLAYLDWSLSGKFDQADLALFTDPRHRGVLIERWTERFGIWLAVPEDLPPVARARLLAVRLVADGAWYADATGAFSLNDGERESVRDLMSTLVAQGAE